MSSLTWLDSSEHDRRRALDVVSLFAEKSTVDEMGLGGVRDGIADVLSPGTSTVQTRAKYFLFVPWIYMDLEARGVAAVEMAERGRRAEIKLSDALVESVDTDGVIGKEARAGLKRLPSAVYWSGLARWGLRLAQLSQEAYHRSVDRLRAARNASTADYREAVNLCTPRAWHPAIPSPPRGFPAGATLALTRAEAEYLRERIMARAPATLLAFLVDRGRPAAPVQFPWIHPQVAEFPQKLRTELVHARNFSEAMHGSALLYNLMVAEAVKNGDWIADYVKRLDVWTSDIEGRLEAIRAWDRISFWNLVASGGARGSPTTRAFVETWIDLVIKAPGAVKASRAARRLVEERETALKGALARLRNAKARDAWAGASGDYPADYRWRVTQRVVADIHAGLMAGGDDA